MATVVITFFLFTRFCVYKMDADFLDRRRSGEISQREKRWSMNSQRLEEIVAELMKPISDVRRSFDTDLSALLEEYLTEAGLHALEASEEDGVLEDGMGAGVGAGIAPNFTELALLLQHSASVYGRKVDFLYQHVLSVSDSLQNSAHIGLRYLDSTSGSIGTGSCALTETISSSCRRSLRSVSGSDVARVVCRSNNLSRILSIGPPSSPFRFSVLRRRPTTSGAERGRPPVSRGRR
ncbi:unnamed protein product [Diatraea saccharalis]|uniref:Condensin II complex subunit H2 N-terminal domain-containing protein n=1 Tax=Diatraea saccharalis TaxID=40085 RepID=A0A9N9R1H4_9NEOP|nr:unnamed protein product [Diatraea saccharalis]